jgi:hypothetical protein
VANKTWISDWLLDLFAWITSHNKLQSLRTISSTALVVHWDQLLQQRLLSTGNSLKSSGTNWINSSSLSNQTDRLARLLNSNWNGLV